MYFFILFLYVYSHKHIKTHHDFNIFILVTQCQDCGDAWCYDSKADKRFGFLSRLAVSTCFAVLEAAPGKGVLDAFLSVFLSLLSHVSVLQTVTYCCSQSV